MKFCSLLGLAACALLFVAQPASAVLYKWSDENGRVVYGDTPPPGVKAERLNAVVAPADPNAVRDMAAKDAQIKKRQQDREDENAKAQKAEADAKIRLDQCAQIRGRLQTLRLDVPLYRFNEKGDRVYYDTAGREKAIADSEKQLRSLDCPATPTG